jgi:anti-sigma regulatory factor (Ser/Thr protein kinase)
LIVRYDSYLNKIIFPAKVSVGLLPEFAVALRLWNERKPSEFLTLDFSGVTKAFANGMLGIIAQVSALRLQGNEIVVILPHQPDYQEFFLATNWAHLLNPLYPLERGQKPRHFAQQFTSFAELPDLIFQFMNIVMRYIAMPKDILSALEWSVNEVCDNVINHAGSGPGGFLQIIAYPQNETIAFSVADAGNGILTTLREGYPNLDTDLEAIEEALKTGVTRNIDHGMGNGLAGTLRIINMTGGSLDILSGRGRLLITPDGKKTFTNGPENTFFGTCVSGNIRMRTDFSIADALNFTPFPYEPYTVVDAQYELAHEDALRVIMKAESGGTGTRQAGKEMRYKLLNLMEAKPNYPLYVDWEGIPVIASSFADECMGKLYTTVGQELFERVIRNTYMEPLVAQLISKAISERSQTK